MPRRYVAYYRVSTERQGRSGLGLEAQRSAVRANVEGCGGELVAEFTEVESGKRADRPELAAALAACRRHRAVLCIAKLDRLARNVAFIANMMDSGVDFVACDMPHASRLTLHILAAVAEHEREAISSRTIAALAAARARGRKLGWSKPGRQAEQRRAAAAGAAASAQATRRQADAFAAGVRPIISEIQRSGAATYTAVAEALNARGIQTARGGAWHATTVRNVLQRVA